ncbi:L-rhamnose mutarotase [Leucobacter sp. NPDC015123]|uniref:L-rhamnose mutarotase n=1 Tax=Leucobacter sp. NPDC015123 TaxID=3364129 RepID=UPI0036F4AA49
MTGYPVSGGSARRFGFVVNVLPEKRAAYLELHRAVWPRVEEAMRENGIHNYSIFIVDDTLFGVYDYVGDDYEADMARVQADETSREWWTHTDPCQVPFGAAVAATGWREMEMAWHMD